jgi:GT2 family glycosyltransferase
MLLSIIIVNYNVKHYLEQCLCSINRAVSGIAAEIFVVDNASTDGSLNFLQPLFPDIQFISNDTNLGFAKANNQALNLCTGKYVLFLNPDTLVPEEAISTSLSYMQEHPEAGAIGIRMIDGNGYFLPESKRAFPTPMACLYKLSGLASLFPRSGIFNKYALGNLDQHTTQPVQVLAGACMMVQKKVLESLNGFDERYFMYGEDIDLSYRLAEAGYQNHYFADTTVLHFKGKSSRKESFAYVKQFYGAMLLFVKKQYTSGAGKKFSLLMQSAIAIGGILSSFRRLFMLDAGTKNETKKRKPIWIVATAEEYTEISSLLEKSQTGCKEFKRVSVDNIKGNAFCTLAELPSYLLANKGINIIFSIGTLTVSQILPELERLSDKSGRFHFHIQGTKGMAGTEMLSL